jgi:hypothetical protein
MSCPCQVVASSRLPPPVSSLQRLTKSINNQKLFNTRGSLSQGASVFIMARRRYTSYVAPQSDSSDAEDHIFVGKEDKIKGGVRKRVGDINF